MVEKKFEVGRPKSEVGRLKKEDRSQESEVERTGTEVLSF